MLAQCARPNSAFYIATLNKTSRKTFNENKAAELLRQYPINHFQ